MEYKYTIDKSFNWEMGHRVWAQSLNRPHLSITTDCQCKHLHGHSYTIKVMLGADHLNDSGMVLDFKELQFMKVFVDDVLDHKFMIDVNDPNFEIITGCNISTLQEQFGFSEIPNFTNLGYNSPSDNEALQLHRDSFVLVNFIPTSENICRYIKEYAESVIGDVAKITALELWETKKSHCRYKD